RRRTSPRDSISTTTRWSDIRNGRSSMIDMTLEMAETAMKAAQTKARALKAPMTITVVDEAGRLVLTARGDGTGFFSPETSRAKAMAAASFKKRTAELADLVAKGGFWSVVPTILQGQILPTPGGSPIGRGGGRPRELVQAAERGPSAGPLSAACRLAGQASQ